MRLIFNVLFIFIIYQSTTWGQFNVEEVSKICIYNTHTNYHNPEKRSTYEINLSNRFLIQKKKAISQEIYLRKKIFLKEKRLLKKIQECKNPKDSLRFINSLKRISIKKDTVYKAYLKRLKDKKLYRIKYEKIKTLLIALSAKPISQEEFYIQEEFLPLDRWAKKNKSRIIALAKKRDLQEECMDSIIDKKLIPIVFSDCLRSAFQNKEEWMHPRFKNTSILIITEKKDSFWFINSTSSDKPLPWKLGTDNGAITYYNNNINLGLLEILPKSSLNAIRLGKAADEPLMDYLLTYILY